MFIAKNNDLIILANESREQLEQQLKFMVYTSIEETTENYRLINGVYVNETEYLALRKAERLKENESIRDEFLISGVIYKNILWDSDIEQKLNISVTVNQMSEEDVINWVAMDGVTSLECTKADLLSIGQLLTTMTTYVWQIKNPEIKLAIQNAQTIEELEAIEIVYSLDEINNESDNVEEQEEL